MLVPSSPDVLEYYRALAGFPLLMEINSVWCPVGVKEKQVRAEGKASSSSPLAEKTPTSTGSLLEAHLVPFSRENMARTSEAFFFRIFLPFILKEAAAIFFTKHF